MVVSSAIAPENPERVAARERGLRELHRADLLGEITRLRPTIAVTGTHGKTTTSSMVVHALRGCGLDPSYLVGGEVRSTGSNAGWGAGEWLVVEADESDRSLLKLAPRIAVLTNAELDHHATYSSQRDVDETFRAFLARPSEVVLGDEPDLDALPRRARAARGRRARAAAARASASTGSRSSLPVPGVHNARNAATALAACRARRAPTWPRPPRRSPTSPAPAAASSASGRTPAGALVVDDYAHHPTEVRATIAAARTLARARRRAPPAAPLLAHAPPVPRVRRCARAGRPCRRARRLPRARGAEDFPGVTGRLVAAAAADSADGRRVAWLPDFDSAERFLRAELRDGDLLLTLGAGNVDALGRRLLSG